MPELFYQVPLTPQGTPDWVAAKIDPTAGDASNYRMARDLGRGLALVAVAVELPPLEIGLVDAATVADQIERKETEFDFDLVALTGKTRAELLAPVAAVEAVEAGPIHDPNFPGLDAEIPVK